MTKVYDAGLKKCLEQLEAFASGTITKLDKSIFARFPDLYYWILSRDWSTGGGAEGEPKVITSGLSYSNDCADADWYSGIRVSASGGKWSFDSASTAGKAYVYLHDDWAYAPLSKVTTRVVYTHGSQYQQYRCCNVTVSIPGYGVFEPQYGNGIAYTAGTHVVEYYRSGGVWHRKHYINDVLQYDEVFAPVAHTEPLPSAMVTGVNGTAQVEEFSVEVVQ